MATVSLTVSGRVYDIACDDSQVTEIQSLGQAIDNRAQAILAQVGAVPDARLLLMVSLTLAHELEKAQADLARAGGDVNAALEGDEMLADGIEALAARIEAIAERLERA